MKAVLTSLLTASLLSCQAVAHYTMQYLWVNGVDQGLNTYLRVPPTNNPVTDVTSADLTGNVNGRVGVTGTAKVTAGQSLTLEWHQHAQRTGEDPISGGHKGPFQVYVAKAPSSATTFDGSGTVWTKVYSSGLIDAATSTWASDVVNGNGGKVTFTFPKCLPSGDYLVRGESIALHVAQSYPGAQFYIGIAQITVTGGGTTTTAPKIALPGAYVGSDPGITVNIYNQLTSYTAPGGPVFSC